MEILIGPATAGEAEAILKLQYLCFQQEAALYDDYSLAPLTQTLSSLLLEYDSHRILAARLGNEVIGSARAIARDGTCYIGRVIVHPRLQKRGIGKRLVEAIEREFPGVQRYELFTGDRSEGNLRFYAGLGYVPFRTAAINDVVKLVYMEKLRGSR